MVDGCCRHRSCCGSVLELAFALRVGTGLGGACPVTSEERIDVTFHPKSFSCFSLLDAQICEFALAVAGGPAAGAAAPMAARQQIIAAWVKAKQLLQQPVSARPGTEQEVLSLRNPAER